MGFFKSIGKKLSRAPTIGKKVAKSLAIGMRKVGKGISRASEIAGEASKFISLIPDPRAQGLAEALEVGSEIGGQVGTLGANVGRSGSQYLKDGDQKALLERTRTQQKKASDIFKN